MLHRHDGDSEGSLPPPRHTFQLRADTRQPQAGLWAREEARPLRATHTAGSSVNPLGSGYAPLKPGWNLSAEAARVARVEVIGWMATTSNISGEIRRDATIERVKGGFGRRGCPVWSSG
jgi:hypothetical protein